MKKGWEPLSYIHICVRVCVTWGVAEKRLGTTGKYLYICVCVRYVGCG